MTTQDVSKKGLKYGDEDEDEAEKKELEAQKVAFRPLTDWLKKELAGQVGDGKFTACSALMELIHIVVLTNRLVTSPCTIVVGEYAPSLDAVDADGSRRLVRMVCEHGPNYGRPGRR